MKNKKYITVKLRAGLKRYQTLYALNSANKITQEQTQELIKLSNMLISELLLETTKLKKQDLINNHKIDSLSGL